MKATYQSPVMYNQSSGNTQTATAKQNTHTEKNTFVTTAVNYDDNRLVGE